MSVEFNEEFRDFMSGRWAPMVRLAYLLSGDQGHAEDIAQTAFARVYSSWGRVRRADNPDAYLRTIVIRENSKRFRKQRVREDPRADVPERKGVVDDSAGLADRVALIRPVMLEDQEKPGTVQLIDPAGLNPATLRRYQRLTSSTATWSRCRRPRPRAPTGR